MMTIRIKRPFLVLTTFLLLSVSTLLAQQTDKAVSLLNQASAAYLKAGGPAGIK